MTTIMFPDFKGQAWGKQGDEDGFVARVRRVMPDTRLMPIFNGASKEELYPVWVKAAHSAHVAPRIYDGKLGLLGALSFGYECLNVACDDEEHLVRLDTAEHPPEHIPTLLTALEDVDMVIGDLDFSQGCLVENTLDQAIHLDIFPELFGQATGGKLRLSCAHEFQAFKNKSMCIRALVNAGIIERWVGRTIEQQVTWGFDGMMALGALAAGLRVKVIPILADPKAPPRNRDRKKITDQFKAALHVCRSYEHICHYGSFEKM